ncbi:MAG: flagellar hook capping FlgD N-terminal domain-containing protein [bacterium]|nr:flagellar hook capping FlgD N-terminal domain-containing protein [bacterium]
MIISPIATDANGKPKSTGSMQSLGKDEFLQLLVAKLEYQDPLDPMQDEDFVAQLAQFSSLEQMNNISEGIATSNEWDYLQMQSINNTMAAGLIGKDVTASYSGLYFDGETEPQISYETGQFASEVTITIKDDLGTVVNTITKKNVESGINGFKWDGKNSFGNRVTEGSYSVEVTAVDASGGTFKPSLSLTGKVDEIRYRDGVAYLIVSGSEIPMGDISAIAASE